MESNSGYASAVSKNIKSWGQEPCYHQILIIAIRHTNLLIILLRASIHQVTKCTRKLHIVVHMNLR